ncbi:MAG TPA: GntR family transcriptional regulator [Methylomirabilota bacterium]|nr:GntR family transcriptional regulator [Methylomirabilota bacterium]
MKTHSRSTDHTLAEDIADSLRRDILRGKLLPGTPLKERDRAAELGVSRTPMREAIRILAKERLVELRPSRSPLVAAPTMKEIADQVQVMLTLEKLSAELACANASDADIEAIRAINDRMAAIYDTADNLDLFEIDMSFHTAVARASHNEPLAETHRAFLARLWRARYLAASQRRNLERVMRHHNAILDALAARDVEAVRAAIDAHLGQLTDDIRAAVDGETEDRSAAGLRQRRNSSNRGPKSTRKPVPADG